MRTPRRRLLALFVACLGAFTIAYIVGRSCHRFGGPSEARQSSTGSSAPESRKQGTDRPTSESTGEASEVDTLAEALASGEPSEWRRAQRRLSQLGALTVPRLLRALADDRPQVRKGAINVLRAFSGQEYAAALVSCVDDPALRGAAFAWMKHLKTDAEVGPLAEAVLDASRPRGVRQELIGVLSYLPGEEARSSLLWVARGDDPRLRGVAVCRLYKVPGDEVTKCLLAALDDPTPRVVEEAVRALGKRQAVEAIDALSRLIADPPTELSVLAAEALGKIGDPRAIPVLAAALESLPTDDGTAKYVRSFRLEANRAIKAVREAERKRALPAEKPRRSVPPL